jgi:molecular chaperone GrpE (heat shock protein)
MKEPKAKTNPPAINFGKSEETPENPPNPNPEPEGLVNENEEKGTDEEYVSDVNRQPEDDTPESQAALVARLEQEIGNLRIKLNEKTAKITAMEKTKSNYSDVSRKFRIFLNLLQGFAARGSFDQTALAAKPGSEHNIMRHIAGLTEVAQKATENRF